MTYTNAAKSEMLGVPASLVAAVGAVSREVAGAMAEGALARSSAGVSVAVTGIAGPGGGTAAKPVGLVHLAAAVRGGGTLHQECRFGAIGRSRVRERSVEAALALVRRAIGAGDRAREDRTMFEGFTRTDIQAGEAMIHLRHGGHGPPLLLLHGNPMTHASWGKIAGDLARDYTVVAADLRGYGDSSAPEPDATCSNYSFRAMANDQVEVMRRLGHERFFVAGHDRGARVAHRMALDHPDKVVKVALLDILPTLHIWENVSQEWALSSWHWSFMPLANGLPEMMLGAIPPAVFMEKKIGRKDVGLSIFDPEALAEYIRCFNAKTIKGSCADYRAAATVDVELDRADRAAGRRVACPVLLLWGRTSHTEQVHGGVIETWRSYIAGEIVGEALEAGHYVNEHRPAETLAWFRRFFV